MAYHTLFRDGPGKSDPVIYGLVDPREPEHVRYVGQTVGPAHRYRAHCAPSACGGNVERAHWVVTLRDLGLYPTMVLLERAASAAELVELERAWIARLRAVGQADLNSSSADGRRAKLRTRAQPYFVNPRHITKIENPL